MQKNESNLLNSNKKFLDEVLSSEKCPKNFEKIYKDFEKYQRMALEMLWEFHNICEKNNVLYEVACGSLLGLIRDGGQLPWDYDIDVFVPIEKKKDLIKALEKDLPKNYYYNHLNNNEKCRHMIMRLVPVGYRSESLHLDVFFIMGAPSNKDDRIKLQKTIKSICSVRFYKYVDIKYEGYKRPKHKIKLILKRLQYLFVSMEKLMKKYYSLCEKYPAMSSEYNILADINATVMELKSKDLWNTTLKKDNLGHELRIPKNYDAVLKARYGDYNIVPNIDERIKEVIVYHRVLSHSKIKNDTK